MKKNIKTIGILGGMGPLATANLFNKIIKISQEKYHATQDTDFPPMFVYSLPLVGFDETGLTDPNLVKDQLVAGVKKLELAGSDFIIIACNSVHYFIEDMRKSISIPIISMIQETAKQAKLLNYKRVGVICSESTSSLRVYEDELKNLSIDTVKLESSEQKTVNAIILKVMAGQNGEKEKNELRNIIENMIKKEAEGIILGCTEIPLAITQLDTSIKVFDSNQVIAEVALKFSFGLNQSTL